MARELVNRIQRIRREQGFDVSDRIRVAVAGPESVRRAVAAHRDYIAGETLAVSLEAVQPDTAPAAQEVDLDGTPVRILVERAIARP
jgi:isoleucyl-tRNA synthetase